MNSIKPPGTASVLGTRARRALLAEVRDSSQLQATDISLGSLEVSRLPGGTILRVKPRVPVVLDFGIFSIVAVGPGTEPDWADERYWVKQQYASNTGADTGLALTVGDMTIAADSFGLHVVATRLEEVGAAVHSLATDGTVLVHVYGIYDSVAAGSQIRYFFSYAIATALPRAIKVAAVTPALLGDLLSGISDEAVTWDNNGSSHYVLHDLGNGHSAINDIYPCVGIDDTVHVDGVHYYIATVYARLKDTS